MYTKKCTYKIKNRRNTMKQLDILARELGLNLIIVPLYTLINDNGVLVKVSEDERDLRLFLEHIEAQIALAKKKELRDDE
jgi:hypothetical protein